MNRVMLNGDGNENGIKISKKKLAKKKKIARASRFLSFFAIVLYNYEAVIHVSVNIKNKVEKDTTLFLFFFLKVRVAMRFLSK